VTLPRLYAVLDSETADRFGWALDDLARACLAGGARLLQIRAKNVPSGRLLGLCDRIVEEASAAGANVVVNDRADVAELAGAWGVHLGQDDLPPRAVRTGMGDRLAIGLSTHTPEQIARAFAEPVSYLAVGPVFATASKATGYQPVGLELVRTASVAARARGRPLVAIGGITLDRAPAVIEAGADSVAVIGDLFAGAGPEARTRDFVDRLVGTGTP
jgi:thiamine-phosphate pyrophosphorylase